MHQEPEHEDYDDDEYNYYPEYNDYGYPKQFNIDWVAWEKWLSKTMKEIAEEDENVWIFGTSKDNVSKINKLNDKYFMYIGNNYHDESIWKHKYFVLSKIDMQYKQHISSHPGHMLRQPNYYKSMFDILN